MGQIDLPSVLRRSHSEALLDAKEERVPNKGDDLFDVPTFIRRRSE